MRTSKYRLTIAHLYPELLNLYGDKGNIIALQHRCSWRGVQVDLKEVKLGDDIPSKIDIFFIGGGQDQDEYRVYKALLKQKKVIKKAVDEDRVILAVCAGFQLLGNKFLSGSGEEIPGLGVIDAETIAPGDTVNMRCLGNIATRINEEAIDIGGMPLDTLVGFENHIGQTYLGKDVKPLGFVLKGKGNNAKEGVEGAVYKNVLCSYMHGSLLPKNPHLADFIIIKALRNKYGNGVRLKKLDDKEEIRAHQSVLNRMGISI
ncbi:MAG: glutamine amidotransferase [Candidatus Dojkabacteria bacterium]|nr:glutamine amidotransferase [Candidatus Dojkabacteria bacterium]